MMQPVPQFRSDAVAFRHWMDQLVDTYNNTGFIASDPVSVPHLFTDKADREIAGLFAATLAWGNRTTILNKCQELFQRMDNAPYEFIRDHQEADLRRLEGFVHRTFNDTDLLYFIHRLRRFYTEEGSLEKAFFPQPVTDPEALRQGLAGFRNRFFDDAHAPVRTGKHVASPDKGSACKRLNMYLRWMVRQDDNGVDLGIWTSVSPSVLFCPLDVHVARIARKLGLLERPQDDWKACEELTANLRLMDPSDPVKYDFALFSIGVRGLLT